MSIRVTHYKRSALSLGVKGVRGGLVSYPLNWGRSVRGSHAHYRELKS